MEAFFALWIGRLTGTTRYWRWRVGRWSRRLFGRWWRTQLPHTEALSERPVHIDDLGIREVEVRGMRRNDLLTIATSNSVYFVRIDDPTTLAVIVVGGPDSKFFSKPRHVRLNGSLVSDYGSMLMMAKIMRGRRMEFAAEGASVITTSTVRGIVVNGKVVIGVEHALLMHGDEQGSGIVLAERLH